MCTFCLTVAFTSCPAEDFQCANSNPAVCIPERLQCNGRADCPDGSDESFTISGCRYGGGGGGGDHGSKLSRDTSLYTLTSPHQNLITRFSETDFIVGLDRSEHSAQCMSKPHPNRTIRSLLKV